MGLFMKLFQKHGKSADQKKHDYDLTYDNVAIPEIHTHKVTSVNDGATDDKDACYDSVAIPEVHIKKNTKMHTSDASAGHDN